MAVFELIAVDGQTTESGEKTVRADGFDEKEIAPYTRGEQAMLAQVQALRRETAQLAGAILAQQSELAKLNHALSLIRVSRTQELAIQEAIRARAREIMRVEGLPAGADRRIAQAIRSTIRETTGARAAGDIQASQFDRVMSLVGTWRMAGALRRIRRSMEDNKA